MLLLFMTLMSPAWANKLKKTVPEWCWTRPNLDAKVKEGVFGINWGVCEGYIPPKDGEEHPL